jgi:hypothetical protein
VEDGDPGDFPAIGILSSKYYIKFFRSIIPVANLLFLQEKTDCFAPLFPVIRRQRAMPVGSGKQQPLFFLCQMFKHTGRAVEGKEGEDLQYKEGAF